MATAPQYKVDTLVGRALKLAHTHGSGHHYAGMGLWAHCFYESGRLLINNTADGMVIRLDGGCVYGLRTIPGHEDAEYLAPQMFVEAALEEIDRLLILDDLAAI